MRKLTPAEMRADEQRDRAREAEFRESRAIRWQMAEDRDAALGERVTALEARIEALEQTIRQAGA